MFLAAITPVLLLAAFILLLLDTLSAPIIKSIYLFKLIGHVAGPLGSSANANAKFGIWGYCFSGVKVAIAGFSVTTHGVCTKKTIGYKLDPTIADLLNIEKYSGIISRTLTAVLVLHPVACALTFLALILSLFMLRRTAGTTRGASLLTLLASLLAALVTTAVFLIDVIFVAIVRQRVRKESDGDVTLTWGNAVWMALGATIALWLAILGATCGLFQIRRARRMSTAKAANTY